MAGIGIIGAGVAGLQLGLFLRQHDIPATIYSEKTPEQILAGRLPALVARFAPTLERERALGIPHWDSPDFGLFAVYFSVNGPQPLAFTGHFAHPGISADLRIYYATLLEMFAAQGGCVMNGTIEADDLARLADEHDLIVVSSGRGSLTELFPRLPEHSPYTVPQRHLCAGLFHGITHPEPLGVAFSTVPGQGEIFDLPILSFAGRQSGILVEAIPGGALDLLIQMRYEDDPRRFETTLLGILREHTPGLYARIDPDAFALTRPLDLLQGAITPTVRRGYHQLTADTFAVALGDVHVTHDPILAQGANGASYAAWALGEAIRDGGPFDASFCAAVERRAWEYLLPAAAWSNAFLQPRRRTSANC